MIARICQYSIRGCDNIKEELLMLLNNSKKQDFNFISTLQKCLTRLTQKHNKFISLSMKQIARDSNTLDYAVLFT